MKKITALLFFIFFLGVFLRLYYLSGNNLIFAHNQARDAFVAKEILSGDLKIQGPTTNTPGLYHGVLWFYVIAPLYGIFSGSPVGVIKSLAVISSLSAILVFILCRIMTKKTAPALLAALLTAVSVEMVQYSSWLSNPIMSLIFTPLIYIGLWLWTDKKFKRIYYAPILTGIAFGLAVQSELFLVYHVIPIAIWLYLFRKNIRVKEVIIFCLSGIVAVLPIIIAQIKFDFPGIAGATSLFSGDAFTKNKTIADFIVDYFNQVLNIFKYNFFPLSSAVAGLIGAAAVIWGIGKTLKEERQRRHSWHLLVLIFLFSHLPISFFGGSTSYYTTVGIGFAAIILMANFVYSIWNRSRAAALSLVVLIVGTNIFYTSLAHKNKENILAHQKEMTIANQIALIDYTYQTAGEKPFTINSITAPLWVNITWTYLYKWYGLHKYGYLPYFSGRDQVGQPDSLPISKKPTETSFLIIEPEYSIPKRYIDDTIAEEDTRTKKVDQKFWGDLSVQERVLRK